MKEHVFILPHSFFHNVLYTFLGYGRMYECGNVKKLPWMSINTRYYHMYMQGETMFPQHCSRLLWNTEECMNMKEYMLNVEELIYSSTFYFSTMSPNIVLDLGITKYNLQSYIIISAQTDMAKRMFPVEMTNKLQLTLSDPVRQIN